jgi:hypothetical protein
MFLDPVRPLVEGFFGFLYFLVECAWARVQQATRFRVVQLVRQKSHFKEFLVRIFSQGASLARCRRRETSKWLWCFHPASSLSHHEGLLKCSVLVLVYTFLIQFDYSTIFRTLRHLGHICHSVIFKLTIFEFKDFARHAFLSSNAITEYPRWHVSHGQFFFR